MDEDVKRSNVPLPHRLAALSNATSLHNRSEFQAAHALKEQGAPHALDKTNRHSVGGAHALKAFNTMLKESTEQMVIPQGEEDEIPHCKCETPQPCRMVHYNPLRGIDETNNDNNSDIYVCANMACMFWQIIG